jgi:hypothetical protein
MSASPPESAQPADIARGRLSAIRDQSATQRSRAYSMTSSAMARSVRMTENLHLDSWNENKTIVSIDISP